MLTDGKARGFLALPVPAAPPAPSEQTSLLVAMARGNDKYTGKNAQSVKLNSLLEGLTK